MSLYTEIGDEKIEVLIDELYDLIEKDSRLNNLFGQGFEDIRKKQKAFFKIYLGAEANMMKTPNLRAAHSRFPISREAATAWQENFDQAIEKIDINLAQKKFIKQKIKTLTMTMINTLKK